MLLRFRDCDRLFVLLPFASSDEEAESPPTPALTGVVLSVVFSVVLSVVLCAVCVSVVFLCLESEREVEEAAPTAPGLAKNRSRQLSPPTTYKTRTEFLQGALVTFATNNAIASSGGFGLFSFESDKPAITLGGAGSLERMLVAMIFEGKVMRPCFSDVLNIGLSGSS